MMMAQFDRKIDVFFLHNIFSLLAIIIRNTPDVFTTWNLICIANLKARRVILMVKVFVHMLI